MPATVVEAPTGARGGMIGHAERLRDRVVPDTWRVECENEDGSTEVAIVSGPNAPSGVSAMAIVNTAKFCEITYAVCAPVGMANPALRASPGVW